jgi:hypothetical protein
MKFAASFGSPVPLYCEISGYAQIGRVIFFVESPTTVPVPINWVGATPFSTQLSNAENANVPEGLAH